MAILAVALEILMANFPFRPETNLHAVFSTRLLLHLRSIAEKERYRGVALQKSHGIYSTEDLDRGHGNATNATWQSVSALHFA